MALVQNAYANCTAKNPETCRYHGKQFSNARFKEFQSAKHMFEILDERIPATKVIPYLEQSLDAYLDETNKIRDNLDRDTAYALHRYTDEYGSRKITAYLNNQNARFHDETEEQIKDQISKLDAYIQKYTPNRQDRVLYRGIEKLGTGFENIEIGKKISFKNFLSTTSSSDVARSFTNKNHPIILEVITDKGAALHGNYMEYEYLLPRDMSFTIASIAENVTVEGRNKQSTVGVTVITLIDAKTK